MRRQNREAEADYPKVNGWEVLHVLQRGTGQEHPSEPARIVDGRLVYCEAPRPQGELAL